MKIYNSILHGSLHPQTGLTPADFPDTSHVWDHCPETLTEIESRLKQVMGNILQLDFNTHTSININQYLNNQKYTPVFLDYFPPEIAFPIPEPQTRLQHFYFFLITAEAKRIKLHLLQSAEILKDDICTKQEIINTLKLLLRYAKQIREDVQPNPIFDFLFTQILKLYSDTSNTSSNMKQYLP